MSSTEDANNSSTGGKPPIFSGKSEDFPLWLMKIKGYQHLLLPKEKSKAAVKLANAQTNDTVAGRIFEVPWDILTSDDGVDAVVAKLKTYYGQKDDLYAWDIFAEWWWSKRKRGESMLEFGRTFISKYEQIQRYDSKLQVSERMLSLVLIAQLQMTTNNRALLLSILTKDAEMTPSGVLEALRHMASAGAKLEEDPEEQSFPSFDEPEPYETQWDADGGLLRTYADGSTEYFSPAGVQALGHAAFLSKGKGKGKAFNKGASTMRSNARPRHPKEGDGKTIKNQKGDNGQILTCYDCDSKFHFAGHPMCPEVMQSLFAGGMNNQTEFSGFADAGPGDPAFQF